MAPVRVQGKGERDASLCLPLPGDAWRFDARERSWSPVRHPHKDKPRFVGPRSAAQHPRDPLTCVFLRVCHTACLGSDGDVVVFGGSGDMRILQDTVSDRRRWLLASLSTCGYRAADLLTAAA